jgi:hypothetical protein
MPKPIRLEGPASHTVRRSTGRDMQAFTRPIAGSRSRFVPSSHHSRAIRALSRARHGPRHLPSRLAPERGRRPARLDRVEPISRGILQAGTSATRSGPSTRRQGYMSEAMRLVLDFAYRPGEAASGRSQHPADERASIRAGEANGIRTRGPRSATSRSTARGRTTSAGPMLAEEWRVKRRRTGRPRPR